MIQKIEYGLLLGLPEGYFSSVYESYGIKKGTTTPPDLRKILDDALEKPECQKPLTAEAASRYRSAVGKISWGGQTRIDLTYFISVLSRGQSTPLVVHETCLRAFLRYLISVDHLKQLMGAEECSGRVEALVDSNWAPERNNDRRSLSGCVILVDGFPIKAFTRQQSSVAMSSAEAELVAITEGAKEAVGVVSLIQHVWGAFRTCQEPPAIFSDSQAVINIGSMHGLLRRVRHIDLRVCWTQAAIQDRLISLSWVRGVDNPADLFTKALAKPHVHYEKLGITEHLPREALLITDADCDQIVLSTLLGRIVSTSALERYARQLDEVNPVRNRWVVVEFCTSVNSGMKLAAEAFRALKVICITAEENGLCEEIIALTRNFVVSMVFNESFGRTCACWCLQSKASLKSCSRTLRWSGPRRASTGVGRMFRRCLKAASVLCSPAWLMDVQLAWSVQMGCWSTSVGVLTQTTHRLPLRWTACVVPRTTSTPAISIYARLSTIL